MNITYGSVCSGVEAHMVAYYNEIDPFAAQWLRELIKQNLIAPGEVDERSIEDVTPNDLKGYTQCHFFAGIGVWSYALRLAGWPDDRPVWTGSCPCQPFSTAGKGAGFADERHLWPAFHWLIQQCRPECVFGEQVAGKAGETWLDLVSTDLEGIGYACGSAVTAACGFGAPHQRKRMYWVADSSGTRARRNTGAALGSEEVVCREGSEDGGNRSDPSIPGSPASSMADSPSGRASRESGDRLGPDRETEAKVCQRGPEVGRNNELERGGASMRPGPTNGFWRDADWLGCRDGKWRAVEPGTFPLADGAPARVGRLRGYGNAIVAQQAQAFIEAYLSTLLRLPAHDPLDPDPADMEGINRE